MTIGARNYRGERFKNSTQTRIRVKRGAIWHAVVGWHSRINTRVVCGLPVDGIRVVGGDGVGGVGSGG